MPIKILITLAILTISNIVSAKKQIDKPNIILIVTDDQAFGDLSITGEAKTAETPVIDRLAESGVFADHFYVSPVCAPTRASLLTGKYHQRTGVSGVTRGRENMQLDEITLADILKSNGYTTAMFGKWHNGAHYPYHPLGRGFDHFVGFTSGHWSNYFNTTIEKDGKPFKTEGYLTDILTDEAIKFIEQSSSDRLPFLCYIPYQSPHTPLQVPDKYFDKQKSKGHDDFNATIYGMAENIDHNIGKIISKLEELAILENCIIIYLSDNGPLNFRYNLDLKGRKGMVDEGGVRVPFILNWKGVIKAGVIIDEPLAHIDLLPTVLDLAGVELDTKSNIDGISFVNLINGQKQSSTRYLYSEWSGKKRVLHDPYLMIDDKLFNIRKDPSQKIDIKDEESEIFIDLSNKYNSWYNSINFEDLSDKPIPIGYDNYPTVILPAHEADLYPPFEFRKDRRHTGIAYHSLYGWAHDWIDFWTDPNSYAKWNIDIVESGLYNIKLRYALAPKDVGVQLQVEIGDQIINKKIDTSFSHSKFPNHDRVLRKQEAPETDWGIIDLSNIKLAKGSSTIILRSTKIPGDRSIELKEIIIEKL